MQNNASSPNETSISPDLNAPAAESPSPSATAPTKPSDKPAPADSSTDLDAELSQKLKRRVKNTNVTAADPTKPAHSKNGLIVALIFLFVLLLTGGAYAFFYFTNPDVLSFLPWVSPSSSDPTSEDEDLSCLDNPDSSPDCEPAQKSPEPEPEPTPKFYSRLSGEPLASESDLSAPTFCVQIPNGADGARPQVGLTDAKVVFEAIAEAGITRFAAIFQNPPAVVGPIRSLRIYYLNWDTPFDCTVVHAGGADDAISALRAYGHRDLTENYSYMWRSDTNYTLNRRWNNLFTSGEYLTAFNNSKGYYSSDIKGFPRFLPEAAYKNKVDIQAVNRLKIDTPADGNTDALTAKVTHITFSFGAAPNFNPVYDYNPETNSYDRSYATGAAHESYDCSGQSGEITPETVCSLKRLSPKVVIAMIVQERKAAYDNYHEDISAIGAGDAYVFQNGDVILATWEKASKEAQIIFRDKDGSEIQLVPGRTWISAVPAYGSVAY
ncbi:DUF3048 domain-containing protein [Candidatus Saccharibacteria bacterium]|nr:DUF3048 domain-containing protein [Candidatus Saccharibacteria bacterium]MBQ3464401.1 DUF3048 domain-containing protein [Candidatus Saccharibacteria bacterium]